jgi:hypothetical protein
MICPLVRSTLLVVCSLLALTACTRTHQARTAEFSGFLKDYSQLRRGGVGEARWLYINPRADFSAYDKLLFDPITVWRLEGNQLSKIPMEDLQQLAGHLYRALEVQLSGDYTIVQQPGPGVMRVRLAITEARKSKPVLDLATNVLPPAIALSAAQRLVTGTHSFVGKAGVEVEFLDASSGVRLLAAVDRRGGRKVLRGKLRTWDDVRSAYDNWAVKTKERLAELRVSTAR